MAHLVHPIIVLGYCFLFTFANAAKCTRSTNVIKCENADRGVIERLSIYYVNDVSLIVRNSEISILETGMFGQLKYLEKLSLTRCGIVIIRDNVFQGLNLTNLNLARNLITNISENVFANLPGLKFLDLSHNAISQLELSAEVGYLPELRYVDVSNNRLNNFTLAGNFSRLETINFENNTLRQIQVDYILHLPVLKEVFFDGNSLNKSYEGLVTFILLSYNIKIDLEYHFFDDGEWNSENNTSHKILTNATATGKNSTARSVTREIEKDFKLSPQLIKSLSPSELTNLVERILTLRNFTLTERKMLELDRKLIQDESRSVKKELTRIDQIIKRFEEVTGKAKEESIREHIEKSCQAIPNDTWWRRFKGWGCRKLFHWANKLIRR